MGSLVSFYSNLKKFIFCHSLVFILFQTNIDINKSGLLIDFIFNGLKMILVLEVPI